MSTLITKTLVSDEQINAQVDTMKKVRLLLANGYSVNEIYHVFKKLGVTTKAGGEVKYQMVRNYTLNILGHQK